MNEIVIGAVASLVASIIWFLGGELVLTFKSRQKLGFLIEMLYDCAEQFDSAMVFKQADIAEFQSDKILEYSARIREETKKFTFMRKKKKLFNTVLYNLYYTISYYKRLSVGYEGQQEQKAKLSKFKRKYYYSIPIYSNNINHRLDERSFLLVSVMLLQELNNKWLVKKALEDNFYIQKKWNVNLLETYLKLIAPLNFNSKSLSLINKYDLRGQIFTGEEYEKYINKKIKNKWL